MDADKRISASEAKRHPFFHNSLLDPVINPFSRFHAQTFLLKHSTQSQIQFAEGWATSFYDKYVKPLSDCAVHPGAENYRQLRASEKSRAQSC